LAGEQALEVIDGQAWRRASEIFVLGRLDPGPTEGRGRTEDRVVAGDRGVLTARRIEALVEAALDQLRLRDSHVAAGALVAGRDDLAAPVLELLREDPRVVRHAGERVNPEDLQVVDVDHEKHEHRQAGDRDSADRPVHTARTTWVRPSSWIGCGAG